MLRCALLLSWALSIGAVVTPTTAMPTAPTPATKAPTTGRPTPTPTPFTVPKLPISKANALYPDCRAEIFFAIDVSSSVSLPDQKTMFLFVDTMIVEVEKNIGDGRYGVVVFGIDGESGNWPSKVLPHILNNGSNVSITGPYGNGNPVVSTELFVELDHLRYNCTNCTVQNNQPTLATNWSQLDLLFNVIYGGWLTPTWDALDMIVKNVKANGDPTVPGRYIILVTDGVPNDGNCYDNTLHDPVCVTPLNKTNHSVAALKEGALLLTVGVGLNNPDTLALMNEWASEPRDVLFLPVADENSLITLIPKILQLLCPIATGAPCLEAGATYVDVTGAGFLDTGKIRCRFRRDGKDFDPSHETEGQFLRDDLLRCPLPQVDSFYPGTWNCTYALDGRGYRNGPLFKYGTVCRPELLVIWWPFCALALLPLAFCRPKKVAPASTTKVTRGVARPAPAATEEYEEYEEVEEIVAPPPPVNKWKVAPTAYIGFGRARLSVDWAGVAPESAPHEGVRKKVVKKVVTDQQPVPVAGPASTPTPAAQPEQTTTTTTTHKPPVVEEPDWVNSFMDRVAAVFCCCCVKK